MLTIDGVAVRTAQITERSPERIGGNARMFAGGLRTSVRGEKRAWNVTTAHLEDDEAEELEQTIENGRFVYCTGALIRAKRTTPDIFRYRVGDDYAALGGVYSRASIAMYDDEDGYVRTAAVNEIRDNHYENGRRTFLCEEASTNLCPRSSLLTDAAWLNNSPGSSAVADACLAPDGTMTGNHVIGDGSSTTQGKYIFVTYTGDGTKCVSVYLRPGTGNTLTRIWVRDNTAAVDRHVVLVTWSSSGVPSLSTLGGSGTLYPVKRMRNGWYRVMFSVSSVVAANANRILIITANSLAQAGSCYVWNVQTENRIYPTSPIATAATAVTRSADVMYFDIPGLNPVRSLSLYARHVHIGAYLAGGTTKIVAYIGSGTAGAGEFLIIAGNVSGHAACTYDDDISYRESTAIPSPVPVYGELIEHRGVVRSDYRVKCAITVDGGTEVVGALGASGPYSFPPEWQDDRLYLTGGMSSLNTCCAYEEIVIAENEYELTDLQSGPPRLCEVTLGDSSYVRTSNGTFKKVLAFTIREV